MLNREAHRLAAHADTLSLAGQPDSALSYYHLALRIVHAISDSAGEARILNNIGAVFESISQLDSALVYVRQAMLIRRGVIDSAGEATSLNNIGGVFSEIGQPDSAVAYYRQALPIFQRIGDSAGEASSLNNIGENFENIGETDSALAYYRRALPIEAIDDRAREATTLNDIGAVFVRIVQRDSALVYFREALPIARGHYPVEEATSLSYIGIILFSIGQLDSALAYARQAWPLFQRTGNRSGEAQMLFGLGLGYRSIGRLDSAVVYFDQAAALGAMIAKHTGSDVNQTSFNETTTDIYGDWALTWLATAHGGDSLAAVRAAYAALAASERGRAQALAQLMGVSKDIAPGADLSAEGQALATRLVRSAAAALVYATTPDTLITWLVRPSGAILASEQAIPSRRLDTLVAAMRYGVAGKYAYAARGGGDLLDPRFLTPADLTRALADSGRTLRRELAALLLPPAIRARLPAGGDLLIVPQGDLVLIPFGLLPVGGDRLLGRQYALRQGPSLAAVAAAEDSVRLNASADRVQQLSSAALIVGDPTMPSPFRVDGVVYTLDDLPWAKTEAKAVADSLGVTALTADAATETAVLRQLPAARLVHLATHGMAYFSEAHARDSFIALGPDSTRDGHLSVGVIIDSITLRADLVVLSACKTAVGSVKASEGALGLQRAMLAKGARSVLVSLWDVDDRATVFLFQRFYHHWLHDAPAVTKSEALRRAQADVAAEARNPQHSERRSWGDPFYWAGFQVVGAP